MLAGADMADQDQGSRPAETGYGQDGREATWAGDGEGLGKGLSAPDRKWGSPKSESLLGEFE